MPAVPAEAGDLGDDADDNLGVTWPQAKLLIRLGVEPSRIKYMTRRRAMSLIAELLRERNDAVYDVSPERRAAWAKLRELELRLRWG